MPKHPAMTNDPKPLTTDAEGRMTDGDHRPDLPDPAALQVGDLVRLNSDQLHMTVESLSLWPATYAVRCVWHGANGEPFWYTFPRATLTKVR